MRPPPSALDVGRRGRRWPRRRPRLALLVVGEDLQLDRQVDLADVDAVGHRRARSGAKLRMLVTPAATSRSQTSWAAAAGVAMTPIATCSLGDDRLELVEARGSAAPPTCSPTRSGSLSSSATMRKPREEKPGVVRQRVAEVADADDDHGQVLGDADLAGDLVAEVLHVVADAAGAVGAEVGQVLAQLGAVHAGGGGELLARAGADAALGEADERAQVDRQPGDRRLGDAPGAVGPARTVAAAPAPGCPAWHVLDSRCSWLAIDRPSGPTARRLRPPRSQRPDASPL